MSGLGSHPGTARRADALYRHRLDCESRELETPIDVRMPAGETPRIEIIRAAAMKLRAIAEAQRPARLLPGARVAKARAVLPETPFAERQARLREATAFLAARGTLISPVNRLAAIRTYWVSGKRQPMLAEDVIALAVERGLGAKETGR